MNDLDSILDFMIIQIGKFELLLSDLLILMFLLGSAFFCIWAYRRLMNKYVYSKLKIDAKKQKLLFRLFSYPIFLILFLTSLHVLGVNIRAFFDTIGNFFSFHLFSFNDKSVSIFDFLLIGLVILLARIGIWSTQEFLTTSSFAKRMTLDSGRRLAVFQIVKYLIYLLALLLILSSIGINISVIAASSAAFFVVIGLGLQNIFNDVLSGVLLLFEGTIEVGDVIEVGDLFGKVAEIQLRRTVIETPDNISIVIPNSRLTSDNVINWSHNDQETRFKVQVGVAYGSDVTLVRKILREAAKSHGHIRKNPEPKVWFIDFGDSALIFELLFWVDRSFDIKDIKSDLRFKIEADFRKNDVRIPFPQRDLHIVSDFRAENKVDISKEE